MHALLIVRNGFTNLLNPQYSRKRSIVNKGSIDHLFRYMRINTATIGGNTSSGSHITEDVFNKQNKGLNRIKESYAIGQSS